MNNKGFTLIELTAIIVVLAAIFLVGFPSLINTAKSDEDKKYNDMVENLCLAGEAYIYANIDNFPELSTPNSKIYLNIANLVSYGSVNRDIINPKTEEVINGHFVTFDVLADNSLECEYRDAQCLVTKDVGDKGLSVFDEVACGTESFYVIPNDGDAHPSAKGNNVTLLAKYNLNVGNDTSPGVIGIQNPEATGLKGTVKEGLDFSGCNYSGEIPEFKDFAYYPYINKQQALEDYRLGHGCDGTIMFSENNNWEGVPEETFIYGEKSDIYIHVETYKKYLKDLGVNVKQASLASYEQFEKMQKMTLYQPLTFPRFWLGSAKAILCDANDSAKEVRECGTGVTYMVVHTIDPKGEFGTAATHNGANNGVRPVIIISKDDIEF